MGGPPDGRRIPQVDRGRGADQAGHTRPHTPPKPGEMRPEEHLQIGAITQYVTTLVKTYDQLPDPHHGIEHQTG
jgi:hypothetical protein